MNTNIELSNYFNIFDLDENLIIEYIGQIEEHFNRKIYNITPNELWRFGRLNYQSLANVDRRLDSIMLSYFAAAGEPRNNQEMIDQVYKLAIIIQTLYNQGKQNEIHSKYKEELQTVLINIRKTSLISDIKLLK